MWSFCSFLWVAICLWSDRLTWSYHLQHITTWTGSLLPLNCWSEHCPWAVKVNREPTQDKTDTGLLRSSALVGFFTMLSRFAGLARDIVFARVIGAEALADVFFDAFKIPN